MDSGDHNSIGSFLSEEEERALSALRDMVTGIRARGVRLDVEALGASIRGAGGRSSCGEPSSDGTLFKFLGVFVSVRTVGDTVELSFLEADK